MRKLTQRTVTVGLVSAGLVRAGGGSAQADTDLTSIGNVGVLAGNQIYAPIQVPINICGNAIAVAGNAVAWCKGGASAVIW